VTGASSNFHCSQTQGEWKSSPRTPRKTTACLNLYSSQGQCKCPGLQEAIPMFPLAGPSVPVMCSRGSLVWWSDLELAPFIGSRATHGTLSWFFFKAFWTMACGLEGFLSRLKRWVTNDGWTCI
jgi:hypothetical protein